MSPEAPTLDTYSSELSESARAEGERWAASALSPNERWLEETLAVIAELADRGTPFDSEAVRLVTGAGPSVGSLGVAFAEARRRGWISCVGYSTSSRPSRHGGIVRVWQGTR
jgi:hypothetical protein